MPNSKAICRLCMSTKSLTYSHENDGKSRLAMKIYYCINVEVHSEDGMPIAVCNQCKKKIKKFFNFKQKCLKVDQILRTNKNCSPVGTDSMNQSQDSVPKYDIAYNFEDDFKDAFEYSQDSTNFYIKNYNNDIGVNEEKQLINKNIDSNPQTNEGETTENIQLSNENESNKLQCELCGCIFETKTMFRKHLSTHAEKTKSFQCELCPKRFTRAETNIIHMRSHMGIKPFICEKCGQSSTKRQDLIRHMKIHSDVRKHACPNCGRSFKRSGDLFSHIRTHTGARPYKCRLCEKDYTSHGGLRKHYKTHYKMES